MSISLCEFLIFHLCLPVKHGDTTKSGLYNIRSIINATDSSEKYIYSVIYFVTIHVYPNIYGLDCTSSALHLSDGCSLQKEHVTGL